MSTTITAPVTLPTPAISVGVGVSAVGVNRRVKINSVSVPVGNAAQWFLQLIAAGGDLNIYSDATKSTPRATYTRNPNCWASRINLTCVPANQKTPPYYPTNPDNGTNAGALVSPRHLIAAGHYYGACPAPGTTYYFVSMDGVVETAVSVSHTFFASNDNLLVLLDRDVSSAIQFAKVMPVGWSASYPSNADGIPLIIFDQEQNATVHDLNGVFPSTGNQYTLHRAPVAADRLALYQAIVQGDSGMPVFAVIDGRPVLLTTNFNPLIGQAIAFDSTHFNNINSQMAGHPGGYQLTVAAPI